MSPLTPVKRPDRDALAREVLAGVPDQHWAERRLGAMLAWVRELLCPTTG